MIGHRSSSSRESNRDRLKEAGRRIVSRHVQNFIMFNQFNVQLLDYWIGG